MQEFIDPGAIFGGVHIRTPLLKLTDLSSGAKILISYIIEEFYEHHEYDVTNKLPCYPLHLEKGTKAIGVTDEDFNQLVLELVDYGMMYIDDRPYPKINDIPTGYNCFPIEHPCFKTTFTASLEELARDH